MPIARCIAEHTHREMLTVTKWIEEHADEPSLTDKYLMQIAAEIVGFKLMFSNHPEAVEELTLDKFRLVRRSASLQLDSAEAGEDAVEEPSTAPLRPRVPPEAMQWIVATGVKMP